MSWMSGRETKRDEDHVYCLMGLFDVHMSLIFGEGRHNALSRLEEQIQKGWQRGGMRPCAWGDFSGPYCLSTIVFSVLPALALVATRVRVPARCSGILRIQGVIAIR
jgi:hypothetical protein